MRKASTILLAAALVAGNASCGGCVKCEYEDLATTCRMTELGTSSPDPARPGWVVFPASYERDRGKDHGALATSVAVHVEAGNERAMRELLQRTPSVPCGAHVEVRGTCSPGGVTRVDLPHPSFATAMDAPH